MQKEEIKSVIGSYRRFGEAGTVYQILDIVDDLEVEICVLETNEKTNYPLTQALLDPREF
ncbi:hypothetical protein [uncultured Nostoc sp.]|uniref:hypothetical protein n=1 Tax=uncultured Nostoc sp. TaxID=340711 RepID=UPI0035CB6CF2